MESYQVEALELILYNCLWGPRGDPDRAHCVAAATAAALLQDIGDELNKEDLETLCSENQYGHDFLKEAQDELKKLKENG